MRKIIKSSNTEEINTFRLHYFPNIPTPAKGGEGGPAAGVVEGDALQRPASPVGPSSAPVDPDRRRREDLERQAYETGFAKGEKEGLAAAQQKSAPLLAVLETIVSELDGVRGRIRQQLEQEVVELALQVARKVVRHELSVSEDAILCVVKEAMANLEDPGKIAIRINPADLKRVQGAGQGFETMAQNLDNIHFEEDPGIECGGCYIQTDYGEIDARIHEQLRAVEEAFRTELRIPANDACGPLE